MSNRQLLICASLALFQIVLGYEPVSSANRAPPVGEASLVPICYFKSTSSASESQQSAIISTYGQPGEDLGVDEDPAVVDKSRVAKKIPYYQDVCPEQTVYGRLYYAQTTGGQWVKILQTSWYRQYFHSAVCKSKTCKGVKGNCYQKYRYTRALVYKFTGCGWGYNIFQWQNIRLPSCCSCRTSLWWYNKEKAAAPEEPELKPADLI
ncbi:uncharacterized protein LOC117102843 [Anneissia japonica]|uniref:uncharacterized protein LOC117102843 n=1 Tax=Anneissia japonica TaxID=1529436 RepID=UPI0014254F63|nr:uncharacterized protein LOC117102843 [Anneissia japonica]